MADRIRTAPYFKVMIADRPGEGAGRLAVLRDAGVNLLAVHGFPSGRRTQLDLVPEDPAALRAAAKRAKWKVEGPKTCFLVEGDDRIGAVAQILEKLAAAKINIIASTGLVAGAGRYGAILWVDPRAVKKASQALGVR